WSSRIRFISRKLYFLRTSLISACQKPMAVNPALAAVCTRTRKSWKQRCSPSGSAPTARVQYDPRICTGCVISVSLDQYLPPRATLNDFPQRREETRREPTVGHAVIHRERELGHR